MKYKSSFWTPEVTQKVRAQLKELRKRVRRKMGSVLSQPIIYDEDTKKTLLEECNDYMGITFYVIRDFS